MKDLRMKLGGTAVGCWFILCGVTGIAMSAGVIYLIVQLAHWLSRH